MYPAIPYQRTLPCFTFRFVLVPGAQPADLPRIQQCPLAVIRIQTSPLSINPAANASRTASLEPYIPITPRSERKSLRRFQASSWVNSNPWMSPCCSSSERGRSEASETAASSFSRARPKLSRRCIQRMSVDFIQNPLRIAFPARAKRSRRRPRRGRRRRGRRASRTPTCRGRSRRTGGTRPSRRRGRRSR